MTATPSTPGLPSNPPAPPSQCVPPSFPPGFLKKLDPYLDIEHPQFDPNRGPVYSAELVAVSSFRRAREWDEIDNQLSGLQHTMDSLFEQTDNPETSSFDRAMLGIKKLRTGLALGRLLSNGGGVAFLRARYLDILRENDLSENEAEAVLRQQFKPHEFVPLDKIVEACLRSRKKSPALASSNKTESSSISFCDNDQDENDEIVTTPAPADDLANQSLRSIESALSNVAISSGPSGLVALDAPKPYKPYALYKRFPEFALGRTPEILAAKAE